MILELIAALSLQAEVPAASAAAAPARKAETVRRYDAGASQGAAAGPGDVYAVSNWRIVRFDKKTGEKRAEWTGDKARFPHINSCAVIARELVCASSNFPAVPQVSTVEIFDPMTLAHKRSISLGLGTGSITWVDRHDGAWWAMFANYDAKGGEPPRDHRHTTLVKFDDQWRRLEAWALPASVLERIKPMSISGGGWGPDGRLYLSGHDLPELYVMQLPMGGGVLDHLDTIAMEAEGQAIDWDESDKGMLYGITRRSREVLAMRVPLAK
ncbi:hypothetical protein G5B46_01910 [Caulobacter sp. 602-2]|uniref:WD40 repeat domain-containing protein n=1 Tax=Caulobacter sp. 602-2 TaxID=2710887 RepID=A0A6G4QSQ0_9CAUL|nr:hypothetical protein [Caulobacter sp. 602-2]NGM48354.1 hypothetical protein [Caulobacter sp. 602-2]